MPVFSKFVPIRAIALKFFAGTVFLALCISNVLSAQIQPAGVPTGTAVDTTNPTGYKLPGITGFKNDQWVGSDNLYNLTSNIGITVEIDKPQGANIPISSEALKSRISALFEKSGITPQPEGQGAEAPLPFFHMLIMAYPVEKSFVAFLTGRLFEPVFVSRIILEKGISWQAITWEKQELVIATKEQFVDQINRSVDEITNNFIERYKYFQHLKPQAKQ